ncbi:hypothetical protein A7982_12918 [Minicystis rosea]|nr:hypothetical protein A7982_12918 [Minicystis rosea]
MRSSSILAVLPVLLSASCDGGCARGPAGAPIASASSSAPASAPPAAIHGIDRITDPTIASAFRAWAERRADEARRSGARAAVRIVSVAYTPYNNIAGGYADVIARARVEAGECTDEILVLKLDNEVRAPPVKIEEKTVGHDCCDDRPCPERPLVGHMFDLSRAIAAKDGAPLARLVDPQGEIEIVLREVGEGENNEETRRFRAAQAEEALARLSPIEALASLSCSVFEADGTASCLLWSGGWEASYTFRRDQRGTFLVSVHEKSH